MRDAGVPPGPRAWHVSVMARLKGDDMDGALAASVAADEGEGGGVGLTDCLGGVVVARVQ
jgi:hypothetical protein